MSFQLEAFGVIMQDYRGLNVWKKAHQLAIDIYELSYSLAGLKAIELFSNVRESVLMIPAFIVKASSANNDNDAVKNFIYALQYASESEYYLEFAKDIKVLDIKEYGKYNDRVREIKRMLTGLIKSINQKNENIESDIK